MVTAAVFRKVRRKVLANALVPRGFAENASSYTRRTASGQIHCIEFAPAKYGGSFTVDLGFHYADVPPFAGVTTKDHGVGPCCLEHRLREPDGNQFFGYGESVEGAEALVTEIAGRALAALDELEARWGKGRALMQAIPPDRLEHDAERFAAALHEATIAGRDAVLDSMGIRQLFPGWQPLVFPVAVLLGFVALKEREPALAASYARVAEIARNMPGVLADVERVFVQLMGKLSAS